MMTIMAAINVDIASARRFPESCPGASEVQNITSTPARAARLATSVVRLRLSRSLSQEKAAARKGAVA
jgi:hypothetical protein